MNKNKLLLLFLAVFIPIVMSDAASIIVTKKVAKIGDEIILKEEVEMIAYYQKVSYEEALKQVINSTLLFISAKIYIPEPGNEQIDMLIKRQKAYYASLTGVEINKITDEDFLRYLHYNNITMESYKRHVKKIAWIQAYVDKRMEQDKYKTSNITEQQVRDFIKKNPEMFLEKEGALLSFIYFSFFNKDQKRISNDEVDLLKKKSGICIKELQAGDKFETMVEKYSDDLISKNADPAGRAGYVFFDDPKVIKSFSKEIIESLMTAGVGIIYQTYQTDNGIYIFKIDEKIKPVKLSAEESEIKARDFIRRQNLENLESSVIQDIIKETKEKVNVILY